MATVHPSYVNLSITIEALEAAGYRIRGRRATCPHCSGRRGLTVSFSDDGKFFCHRCLKGGHVRQLAPDHHIILPPARISQSAIRKEQFRNWLLRKMAELSSAEYELTRSRRFALDVLEYPNTVENLWGHALPSEPPDELALDWAWEQLARYYHKQRRFELFWRCASDKVGRYWLYRAWRTYGCSPSSR